VASSHDSIGVRRGGLPQKKERRLTSTKWNFEIIVRAGT